MKFFKIFFVFVFSFLFFNNIAKADYILDENQFFGAGGIGWCRTATSTTQGSYMYYTPTTDLYINQISFIGGQNKTPTQNIDLTLKIQNATTSPIVYCTSYYTQLSGSVSRYIRTFNFDNCHLTASSTYWFYLSGVCYTGYSGSSIYNSTSVKSNSGFGILNDSDVWTEGTGDYAFVINGNYNLSGGGSTSCGDCICSGGSGATTSTSTLITSEFLGGQDIGKISAISGTDESGITYTIYSYPNLLFRFILSVLGLSLAVCCLLIFFKLKK